MDHEGGPWNMMASFHGPTWWSNFHGPIPQKNQFTKSLGPSPDVYQTGTRRNDHAPKVNVLIFFLYMPKTQQSCKRISKFDHSFSSHVIIFSSPKNLSLHFIITIFLCHGPLPFSTIIFCLSHCRTRWTMLVDNVGLTTWISN